MSRQKIVYIRRASTFIQDANKHDAEVQEYFGYGYQAIGSNWKVWGSIPETGLTQEEQKIILPALLGFYGDLDDSRDSAQFRGMVNKHYTNINTKVPGEGVRLDVSLQDPDKPLSPDNLPKNVRHYTIWKHALAHPQVGGTYMEAQGNPLCKFYVDDQDAIINAAAQLNQLEDKALGLYAPLMRDFDKMERVLVLMGVDTVDLDELEMGIKAKQLATIDDSVSNAVNQQRLERFIEVSENKDMQAAYDLSEMVRVGLLDRVGLSLVIKESGNLIGRNEREAVLWLTDPANSQTVNVLKASYGELAKRKRRDAEAVAKAEKAIPAGPTGGDNGLLEEKENITAPEAVAVEEEKAPEGDAAKEEAGRGQNLEQNPGSSVPKTKFE